MGGATAFGTLEYDAVAVGTHFNPREKKEGYKSMKSPDPSGKSVGDTRVENEILISSIRFRFSGKTVDGDKITTNKEHCHNKSVA